MTRVKVDPRTSVDVLNDGSESTGKVEDVKENELAQSGDTDMDQESADQPLPSTLPNARRYGSSITKALPWILERVRSGVPINHACEAAGFSKQALYKHFNKFPGDRIVLNEAKADGELLLVDTIQAEAKRNANFGLMVLERRRPDEWARPNPQQTNVAVKVDSHLHVKPLEQMSREELEAEALLLAKGSDDGTDDEP